MAANLYIDSSQLAVLFKNYHRALLYFARSMVHEQQIAEEIVSDSFVKLWQRRDAFDGTDKIKAFLYIATKNACLNYVQSAHVRRDMDPEAIHLLESTEPETYVRIVRAELMQQIYAEMVKLPEKQREVFRLTYIEELTTDEICERLHMTPTAVFANRSRAVDTLRRIFKDKELWLCLFLLHELLRNSP
ncbi:RNA polymerase sigma-70 factor [Parapedobacter sp. ISTM3]|uniref:RNA polymerase sigma-70 factor, ECF subfamily n=1 Tax=Parapedobacter luteus TaxID=623280 RepID=A0A1T5A603_9SPHI|nr:MULTISPECIES: RNA polymerase sigma-70 factor [Parapedobacter]MBK1440220.1 RNA polymerase sigma-70 factor [Parapedobacter sp. ISTM3]SKB30411.1 RNA polymerase sigma-70 factor, ECF subfamily [Parapedobacter luteus]